LAHAVFLCTVLLYFKYDFKKVFVLWIDLGIIVLVKSGQCL